MAEIKSLLEAPDACTGACALALAVEGWHRDCGCAACLTELSNAAEIKQEKLKCARDKFERLHEPYTPKKWSATVVALVVVSVLLMAASIVTFAVATDPQVQMAVGLTLLCCSLACLVGIVIVLDLLRPIDKSTMPPLCRSRIVGEETSPV